MSGTYKDLIFSESYVGGEWIHETEKMFSVINPSNLTEVHSVYDNSRFIVNKAIDAAHFSFKSWKNLSVKERSKFLYKWYELLLEHKEELAQIITLESGKPFLESKAEVDYGASYIQFYAEEAKRVSGDVLPGFTADKRILVTKEAVGVVGIITPWNFPLAMITRKIAPALAVGCTVVVRPSEETPLTALALNFLAQKAGFPNGVYNTVIGIDASEMGKELCENKKVAKISFTGSTRVGRILMQQCAPTLKKMSLELGGNAPFIVFEDADLDLAINGALAAKFRFSGQTCVCVNRILVQESIYDTFLEKFKNEVSKLRVGDGLNPVNNIGPLINKNAIDRIENLIKDALIKGGKVIYGGNKIQPQFYEPTIIIDANSDMDLASQEIFGPIAAIFKFSTEEQAIELANKTEFGLASYFYTKDLNRSFRVREQLQYGIVGVNEGLISSEMVPFGGIKQSGQGREGSSYGIESYTEIKYSCFGNVI